MSPLFDLTPVKGALDALLGLTCPPVDLSPIICISHAATRSSRTDVLKAILGEIDETRVSIAEVEDMLSCLLVDLRQRSAAVMTALAPVAGLPTELLVEIFLIVADNDRTSKARITLSHVSSLWRAVALDTKELWTVIQVPSGHPEMMHELARRSGFLRFNLSPLPNGAWPEDLEIGSEEAPRLSVLSVHSRIPAVSFGTSLERHASLICLDKLTISTRGAPDIMRGGMTSTRSLHLRGTSLYSFPPDYAVRMDRLTSLTISNNEAWVASHHLQWILAPLLSHLKLSNIRYGIGSNIDPEDPDERVNHGGYNEQIVSLNMVDCSWPVVFYVLAAWRMPNLTSATLHFEARPHWVTENEKGRLSIFVRELNAC